jgi:class 3 adenylate cyclase
MDKVVSFPRPEAAPAPEAEAASLERTQRTFMCTVLFLDIVEYAKKPVSQQLRVKEACNAVLSEALRDIPAQDRIILDTGDGAAINFLGDPEDALFVAINLARAFARPAADGLKVDVRIGINLGPVRLVRDINGQPSIIGDGINVAERIMSFAASGQVLVSRAYYEVATRISEDYAQLFTYQGSRTDKHVREHEVYVLASTGAEARDVTARRHNARPEREPAPEATITSAPVSATIRRIPLPHLAAALSSLLLMCAVVYYVADRAASKDSAAPRFSPAIRLAEPQPATLTPPAPPTHTTEIAQSPAPTPEREASVAFAPKPSVQTPAPHTAHRAAAHEKPATVATAPVQAPAAPQTPVTPWTTVHPEKPAPAPATPAVVESVAVHTPAPKTPTALVMLAVSPWGEVVVDGKPMGVSPPLNELELAPGMHRLEIRNGSFAPHQEILKVEANQTLKIRHKFAQR